MGKIVSFYFKKNWQKKCPNLFRICIRVKNPKQNKTKRKWKKSFHLLSEASARSLATTTRGSDWSFSCIPMADFFIGDYRNHAWYGFILLKIPFFIKLWKKKGKTFTILQKRIKIVLTFSSPTLFCLAVHFFACTPWLLFFNSYAKNARYSWIVMCISIIAQKGWVLHTTFPFLYEHYPFHWLACRRAIQAPIFSITILNLYFS